MFIKNEETPGASADEESSADHKEDYWGKSWARSLGFTPKHTRVRKSLLEMSGQELSAAVSDVRTVAAAVCCQQQ